MKIHTCLIAGAMLVLAWAPGHGAEDHDHEGDSGATRKIVFVPDISLIADMTGVYRTSGGAYPSLKIYGFDAVGHGHHEGEGHSHGPMNSKNGFNFNYAELGIGAAVDPYFSLKAVLHGSPTGFALEEAFFTSSAIPFGFGIKAGKFLSGAGRINGQHRHYWDFATAPLVNEALFGAEGLNEIGGQLTWTAPTPFFLKLGFEALQGENEAAYGAEGFHDPSYRYRVAGSNGPNAYTGFARWGFDLGPVSVLQGGWCAYGIRRAYHTAGDIDYTTADIYELSVAAHGTRARSWTAGAELTVKWPFGVYRYLAVQAEYLYRDEKGHHYHVSLEDLENTERALLRKKQSGLYCQAVVKPLRWWRLGLRYDLLNLNRVRLGPEPVRLLGWVRGHETWDPLEAGIEKLVLGRYPRSACRITAMTDFNPSEFTLFRLQYAWDPSRMNRYRRRVLNHEVMVQANLFIGTHGAHSF